MQGTSRRTRRSLGSRIGNVSRMRPLRDQVTPNITAITGLRRPEPVKDARGDVVDDPTWLQKVIAGKAAAKADERRRPPKKVEPPSSLPAPRATVRTAKERGASQARSRAA